MAVATRDNRWWWDVLENGPSSVYAGYFDVDWGTPENDHPHGNSVVLLPVPGRPLRPRARGRPLPLGALQGTFTLRYFDQQVPIAPRSLDQLVAEAARRLPRSLDPGAGRTRKHRDGPGAVAPFVGHRPGQCQGTSPGQGGPAGELDGLCTAHPEVGSRP